MRHITVAIVLALVLLLPSSAFAQPQQQPDPDFDAKVAKPAYVDKHPSVVIDEAHHNFHTRDGRYKPLADLLTNDGYTVVQGTATFTDKVLAGHDILIIANAVSTPEPTDSAFTNDEIEVLRKWIEAGGSLLLIADHAPYGAASESLAQKLGVNMSTDWTTDPKNCEKNNASWLVFSIENHLLGEHAITKGRDPSESLKRVTTFTGQSLKGPEGSVAFLKLGDTAKDAPKPRSPEEEKAPAAGRAQGIAFKLGQGRVVVMGEAAALTAQMVTRPNVEPLKVGMNYPGCDNKQLVLNIAHWLSGLLD